MAKKKEEKKVLFPVLDINVTRAFYGKSTEETSGIGELLQVFHNADMRNRIDGFTQRLKDCNIDPKKLKRGQYLSFVNAAKDCIAIITAEDTIVYKKMSKGQKVELRAIMEIPKIFNATGKMDYDEALGEAVNKALARKSVSRASA